MATTRMTRNAANPATYHAHCAAGAATSVRASTAAHTTTMPTSATRRSEDLERAATCSLYRAGEPEGPAASPASPARSWVSA